MNDFITIFSLIYAGFLLGVFIVGSYKIIRTGYLVKPNPERLKDLEDKKKDE